MDTFRIADEPGAIRFAIDGDWSCAQFSRFLEDTNDVYRRLNSVFVLRRAIDNEESRERSAEGKEPSDYSWRLAYFEFGRYIRGRTSEIGARPYSSLIELSNSVAKPLHVDAIAYASPGWIQLIGSWNPLKVLADFVSKWRAENTKREANVLKAQTDRMSIQAELAAKILEQAPKMTHAYGDGSSRLVDLAEEVIKPSTQYLERYGNDARITDAEVVAPREALPPSKKRRRKLPGT